MVLLKIDYKKIGDKHRFTIHRELKSKFRIFF